MSFLIRPVQIEDAKQLLLIYAHYVANTAVTFEYEVPALEEFQARILHTLEQYPYLAAEEDGKILGYAYLSTFHPRAAYHWCAESSIYIDKSQRGKGIGRKLYAALEKIAEKQHILNINACIAYRQKEDIYLSHASVQFHKHLGYHLAGHFHQCGYKFDTWYDMIWMEKLIGEHKKSPELVIPFPEIRKNKDTCLFRF